VRSDVPGGAEGLLVPPAGVAKADGARARVLIEHLRAQVRALEQVPVSLANPPALGAAPPHPACSFSPSFVIAGPDPAIHAKSLSPRPEPTAWMPESQARLRRPGMTSSTPLPPPLQGGRSCLLSKLVRGGLHEIKPEAYDDRPSALAFALAVIAQQAAAQGMRRDLVLWCLTRHAAREWGRPYGPGLIASGLDPALLLIVLARNEDDAAWALEEGLKSRALIAALAATEIKTPLMARRLGLAAQGSCTPCLLLSDHRNANLPGTVTTWRIAARRSSVSFDAMAPGSPAWQLTLERCRGEAPGRSFVVEFSHESFRLRLSAASSDRAAEAGESIERRGASSG
jgi:protein ImuA